MAIKNQKCSKAWILSSGSTIRNFASGWFDNARGQVGLHWFVLFKTGETLWVSWLRKRIPFLVFLDSIFLWDGHVKCTEACMRAHVGVWRAPKANARREDGWCSGYTCVASASDSKCHRFVAALERITWTTSRSMMMTEKRRLHQRLSLVSAPVSGCAGGACVSSCKQTQVLMVW